LRIVSPYMMAKRKIKNLFKYLFLAVLLGGAGLFMFLASVLWGFWEPLPTKEQLTNIRQSEASEVLDRNNELLGKYYIFDRQPVAYEEIPDHLINALIATEDVRFYEHNGIDQRSLLRVVFKSILLGDASSGGGSTISQQLIKNLYPRKDHGVFSMPVSKTKEAYLATKIEELYTKEEILTLYLNTVPFGDNTYGVESAAEKFFGVQTSELQLEESAVIVGMLKASYLYNPRLFPERSLARRNTVIDQMLRYGYLTNEEAQIATQQPLALDYEPFTHDRGTAPYFRAYLQKTLEDWLVNYNDDNGTDYDLFTSGLQIATTLDINMQEMAEAAMEEHMKSLQAAFEESYGKRAPWLTNKQLLNDAMEKSLAYQRLAKQGLTRAQIEDSMGIKRKMELWDWDGTQVVEASALDSIQHYLKLLNTGMISVSPGSGAIRAWVGGINYKYFQYDHVAQAKRQVGSTFKPIVYAAALENGLEPCTYLPARAVTYENFDNWTPRNSGNIDEEKDYAVKTALAQSINSVSVRVLEEAEIYNTIELAQALGITSEIPFVPSIALGTAEIPMIEMAKAYTAFVNDGKPAQPYFIKSIKDKAGNILASFSPEVAEEPVFSAETREAMIEMMKGVVEDGTAGRLRWRYGLKNDIAGKTGTTQDNKDGWFVALTPQLVTLTWVGADDYRIGFKSTAIGQGANSALPIYALYQQKLNRSRRFDRYTTAQFPVPRLKVSQSLNCIEEKEPGFLKRVFTNADKPEISKLEIDTAIVNGTVEQEEDKPGLFKRLGGIFKKKDKKKKKQH
jgi:penicillin-binding protein 1A